MAAADKVYFETHADVNSVETALPGPDGKLLRLENGKPYATSDPHEIRLLDSLPHVKRSQREKADS